MSLTKQQMEMAEGIEMWVKEAEKCQGSLIEMARMVSALLTAYGELLHISTQEEIAILEQEYPGFERLLDVGVAVSGHLLMMAHEELFMKPLRAEYAESLRQNRGFDPFEAEELKDDTQ